MPAAAKLPFDVDPTASDTKWTHGKPFKLVLDFSQDKTGDYFNHFHDAWIVYSDASGVHQCKWEMARAEKNAQAKTITAFLNAKSPLPQTAPKTGPRGKKGGATSAMILGTGSGNTFGSSSPPPKRGGPARARTTAAIHHVQIVKLTPIKNL